MLILEISALSQVNSTDARDGCDSGPLGSPMLHSIIVGASISVSSAVISLK